MGSPSAPITIVKFMDFQCPSCKLGGALLHTVLAKYPEKVRIVIRNFPLDSSCNPKMPAGGGHPRACEAARGALCAGEQGKFKEAYEKLFEKQEELRMLSPLQILKTIPGVDAARLDSCAADSATAQKVTRDIVEGETVQIHGTPTYFINGHRLAGIPTLGVWSKLVEKLGASGEVR
jgi:protein-disulfide isomerase